MDGLGTRVEQPPWLACVSQHANKEKNPRRFKRHYYMKVMVVSGESRNYKEQTTAFWIEDLPGTGIL